MLFIAKTSYCPDFRNESDGIFVLGVGIFFRQISTFELTIFDGIFLNHSQAIIVLSLNLKRYFTCDFLFAKLWGFKYCHFGQFGTINARFISRY